MELKRHHRLLTLNAALLVLLAIVTLGPGLRAAADASLMRPRGDYTMVSARIQGATANYVYVVDSTNAEIVSLKWNRNAEQFEIADYRDITEDSKSTKAPR